MQVTLVSRETREPYKALHTAPALNSEDDSPLCISGRGAGSRGKEGNYVPAEAKHRGHQLYPKDKRTAKEIAQAKFRESFTMNQRLWENHFFVAVTFFVGFFFKQNK